jgi:fibronectin type 3 domain-containing protein
MRMTCAAVDRGVECRWTTYEGDGFAAYRLLRQDANQQPADIARIEDRTHTSFVDTTAQRGVTYSYGVKVVDAQGRVLATAGPTKITNAPVATVR